MPRKIAARDSSPCITCFAISLLSPAKGFDLVYEKSGAVNSDLLAAFFGAGCCAGAFDDSEDLIFAHDHQLFTVNLDFGAAVLPEQNAVAFFDIKRLSRAVFFVLAFTGRNDFAFLGFFLRGVGNNDASPNLFALFDSPHDYAVMKRGNVSSHS